MSTPAPSGTQTRDLVVTRVFDAPAEQAWKAWTASEQVMRWWGPRGFTSPLARMDVRQGGTSLVCMRAPQEFGGQDLYNTWTYRTVVPLQKLEFILNFADSDGNTLDPAAMGVPAGVPRDVRHVITFKAVGANQTEMTVTEYGYTSEQALELSKSGLEECLDKMAESFAAARARSMRRAAGRWKTWSPRATWSPCATATGGGTREPPSWASQQPGARSTSRASSSPECVRGASLRARSSQPARGP